MLAWLRGGLQGEDDDIDQDLIMPDQMEIDEDPETTGAAAFAFNAFRKGLFGTPNPDLDALEFPKEITPRHRRASSDDDVFNSLKKPTERVLTYNDATPPRKAPTGILMTPGTAISKKKSVTFGPNKFHEDTISYETRTGRVRSGLPASYPGKFPSPWTPKVADLPKRKSKDIKAQEKIEIYEDQSEPTKITKSKLKAEKEGTGPVSTKVNEGLRSLVDDQIQALRENTARINDLAEEVAAEQAEHDADVTVNLDEPRSRSGNYWKDRYSSDINQAEKKVEFYKTRKDTSVQYASRKDEQCANLALRLKEEVELRRKMQAEIDKWQKLAMEGKPEQTVGELYEQKALERIRRENSDYRDMIREKEVDIRDQEYQLDRQRGEIERQARRIQDLEGALKQRKSDTEDVSVLQISHENEIRALKRDLRKAELANSGMELLKTKYESSQRDNDRLKQQIVLMKEENSRLKTQQKLSHSAVPSLKASDLLPTQEPRLNTHLSTAKLENLTPAEDIWQSELVLHEPVPANKDPGKPRTSLYNDSKTPLTLVDKKSKPLASLPVHKALPEPPHEKIPTLNDYLKSESDAMKSTYNSRSTKQKTSASEAPMKSTAKEKSSPSARKSLTNTPIMSKEEIFQQLEDSVFSLPPLSPSLHSQDEFDDDRIDFKKPAKPVSRNIKSQLESGNTKSLPSKTKDRGREDYPEVSRPAAKPPSPMKSNVLADLGSSQINALPPPTPAADMEDFMEIEKRFDPLAAAKRSPGPSLFTFEKTPVGKKGNTPKKARSSFNLYEDAGGGGEREEKVIGGETIKLEKGLVRRKSLDFEARRKAAAANVAQMKAKMKAKAADKENRLSVA